ncbi:hypothetical protein E2K93_06005 [Thalassotalea sp. HSM 43]|uniref:PD40 domain-containing protein n=1 Tax=Thalassotalea sp. HSM 43 TaxID=2552945 RepID=UPI00108157C3|nr:PD40 domain-containing protein [Thalassotalea sp. HSM 43]QBY03965.1 hypothetical protein E2K93_06005 [Thalassotalea sp. HSM 43]
MKHIYVVLVILMWVLALISKSYGQETLPVLKGPYMGQTPPGSIAEPFAPGIISKSGWQLEGVFAPGMKEFYYTSNRDSATVTGYRMENNIWQKYIEFARNGEIVFSPDGNLMYMAKGYKERIGDGWSERKSLGAMIDRKDWHIMRLSASSKGTYVFDEATKDGNGVLRYARLIDGKREEPKPLGTQINGGKWTAHPFIAADESYLIWDSELEGGYGGSDLYISYRQQDGSWGPAINMGEAINSDKDDFFASVTPDGKYILFNRVIDDNGDIDIYWLDAQIIESLKVK